MALITGKDAPRYSQNTVDQFAGNGSTTSFALSRTPPTVSSIFVTIDGVKQHVTTYSISASNIVFSEAPPSTSSVEVVHIGSLGPVIVPSDNSVTTQKIVDGNITTVKIANGNITKEKLDVKSSNGTGAVIIPTGTTAERPAGEPGAIRHNVTTGLLEFYDNVNAKWTGVGAFSAVGGSILETGGYRYHTFTSSGTLTVTGGAGSVEYLIVAGGGGGGSDADVGGGGGGGGLLTGTTTLSVQNYSIVVGGGGSRGSGPDSTGTGGGTNGTQGSNSSAFGLTAIGGGYGGTRNTAGGAGGSGGGGGDASMPGGAGTAGQGYAGGAGPGMNTQGGNDSGGGGGAGGAASFNIPGPGLYNAVGRATFSAGGRGAQITPAAEGAANTGNGGTGVRNGGSGIVVVRYPIY